MPHPGKNIQKLSFRAKMAIRLLATGGAKTQREAAQLVGLHPAYMPAMLQSAPAQAEIAMHEQTLNIAAGNLSAAITALGPQAVKTIADLMNHSESGGIRLRAAVELLDRNPQSSKIQKNLDVSMSISGKDAKMLAAAMVESARLREEFSEAANGDYVRITDGRKSA